MTAGGPSSSSHDHEDNRGVWVEAWVINLVERDFAAAVLLSQVLWWFQPGKLGRAKLKYYRYGTYWLLRQDDDWDTDCCLSVRQVRRVRAHLQRLGLVEHRVFRLDNHTMSAWRPDNQVLQTAFDRRAREGSRVTRSRHSDPSPRVTRSRHSWNDSNASLWDDAGVTPTRQSHRNDSNASVRSDSNASLSSASSNLVKDTTDNAAAQGPPAHRDRAEEIYETWWRACDPKPIENPMGVVKILERCLTAGWPDDAVVHALHTVPCVTVNAMMLNLRTTQDGPAATSSAAATAMQWLEGRANDGQ